MTKTTRDIPANEGMTVADRLKAAREKSGMTRKALYEATGIPASSLEKYERGELDPHTSRLQAICEELDVSVNWVLNGEDISNVSENLKPAETLPSANVAETFTESVSVDIPESAETDKNDPLEPVRRMLAELDELRARGFGGYQRKATALVKDIRSALNYLNPDDLMSLAFEQGLYEDEKYLNEADIQDLFTENFEKGQIHCVNIEERILDTVIFGIDFYCLEIEFLHALADNVPENIDLEKPDGWNLASWSEEHDVFIPHVRTAFWTMALSGNLIDFSDEETFPKRTMEAEQAEGANSEGYYGIGLF